MDIKTCLALLLVGGAPICSQADPAVYHQPFSEGAITTWESYTGPTGGGRTYDDFTLDGASAVTAVQWRGEYIDTASAGANPSSANTEAFEVSFWSDAGGQPGPVLTTESIPLAQAAPKSLGTINFAFAGGQTPFPIPLFSYRAALATPFVAAAGRRYWISISSRSTTAQPTWSWYSGSDGNGRSTQDFQGTRYERELDRGLLLEGTPATVTLPTASVAVLTKTAHVDDPTPAAFNITLSAPAAAKIVVRYRLDGTAVNGRDYTLIKAKAKFKPGETSLSVNVQPQGDLAGAAKKKVRLTLQPGGAYTLGGRSAATVKIINP